MSSQTKLDMDREKRRRVWRNALLFGLLALAFYSAFIVQSVLRGLK